MVRRFAIPTLAALAALTASPAAHAADFSPPPPMVVQPTGGWYLRGQIGVGINAKPSLEYLRNPLNSNNFAFEQNSISDSMFIGGGVGYEWNSWLRLDATAEYRSKAQVNAFGSYTFNGGTFGDAYQGYVKSSIFLLNAYVDLGTWECFSPFVGVGVGGAYNTLADFTDIGIGTSGRGVGRNSSEWNLAWALYAGLTYNVSRTFKVDLSYRYLDYGSITDTVDCFGGCSADSYKFSNLHSHDIMLGFRWTCCEVAPTPRYVYTPPPAYEPPPPLHSRG
jgi:opacity protein-like surface antigen